MNIGINTEFVCTQMQDELLGVYDVIFCNIEPQDGACVIDAVIPRTDAEFSIRVNADKTFEVVRVNPDAESRAVLSWAISYLQHRGFVVIEKV